MGRTGRTKAGRRRRASAAAMHASGTAGTAYRWVYSCSATGRIIKITAEAQRNAACTERRLGIKAVCQPGQHGEREHRPWQEDDVLVFVHDGHERRPEPGAEAVAEVIRQALGGSDVGGDHRDRVRPVARVQGGGAWLVRGEAEIVRADERLKAVVRYDPQVGARLCLDGPKSELQCPIVIGGSERRGVWHEPWRVGLPLPARPGGPRGSTSASAGAMALIPRARQAGRQGTARADSPAA